MMKKLLAFVFLLTPSIGFSVDGTVLVIDKIAPKNGAFVGIVDSSQTLVNTANFSGNLSGADTTVQGALETIDALAIGGGSGSSSLGVADETTIVSSPTIQINFTGSGVTATQSGSTATVTIPGMSPSATFYIQNANTLQSGATAYPSFIYVGSSITALGDARFARNVYLRRDTTDDGFSRIIWLNDNGATSTYFGFSQTEQTLYTDGGITAQASLTTNDGDVYIKGFNNLKLESNAGGQYVNLKSSASLSTIGGEITFILPRSTGSVGQVLAIAELSDDVNTLTWTTPSAGGGSSVYPATGTILANAGILASTIAVANLQQDGALLFTESGSSKVVTDSAYFKVDDSVKFLYAGLSVNVGGPTSGVQLMSGFFGPTGVLTIAGYGNTNNENLILNLEDVADQVGITSGSGVSTVTFSDIGIKTTTVTVENGIRFPDGSFMTSAGGSSIGGADTEIQFNNAGSFDGDPDHIFDVNGRVFSSGANSYTTNAPLTNLLAGINVILGTTTIQNILGPNVIKVDNNGLTINPDQSSTANIYVYDNSAVPMIWSDFANQTITFGDDFDLGGSYGFVARTTLDDTIRIRQLVGQTGNLTTWQESGTGQVAAMSPAGVLTLGSATGFNLSGAGGILTMAAVGGSNNESLLINLEGTSNTAAFTSGTGVSALTFTSMGLSASSFTGSTIMTDNVGATFGSGSDVRMEFDTTEGNDTFKIATAVPNTVNNSGIIMITDNSGISTNYGVSSSTYPQLRLQSATGAGNQAYLQMGHDGTNFSVIVGTGLFSIGTATISVQAIQFPDGTVQVTSATAGAGPGGGVTVYPATSPVLANSGFISRASSTITTALNMSSATFYDSRLDVFTSSSIPMPKWTLADLNSPTVSPAKLGRLSEYRSVESNNAVTGGVGISGVAYVPRLDRIYMADNNDLSIHVMRAGDLSVRIASITLSGFNDPESAEFMEYRYNDAGELVGLLFAVGEEQLNQIVIFEVSPSTQPQVITKANSLILSPTGTWTLDATEGMESLTWNPHKRVFYIAKQNTNFEFRVVPYDGTFNPAATEPFDAEAKWGATMPAINDLSYDPETRTCYAIGDLISSSTNDQDILNFDCETGDIIEHWDNYIDNAGLTTAAGWVQSEGIAVYHGVIWVSSEGNEVARLELGASSPFSQTGSSITYTTADSITKLDLGQDGRSIPLRLVNDTNGFGNSDIDPEVETCLGLEYYDSNELESSQRYFQRGLICAQPNPLVGAVNQESGGTLRFWSILGSGTHGVNQQVANLWLNEFGHTLVSSVTTRDLGAKFQVIGSSDETQMMVAANLSQTTPLAVFQSSTGAHVFDIYIASVNFPLGFQTSTGVFTSSITAQNAVISQALSFPTAATTAPLYSIWRDAFSQLNIRTNGTNVGTFSTSGSGLNTLSVNGATVGGDLELTITNTSTNTYMAFKNLSASKYGFFGLSTSTGEPHYLTIAGSQGGSLVEREAVKFNVDTTSAAFGNVGIMVSTPAARLSVGGHIQVSSAVPAISGCGTDPSIAGNDVVGTITIGTGGVATSCTVTFVVPWTNQPTCTSSHEGAVLFTRNVTTHSTLVIDAATPLTASGKLKYSCIGYE